MSRTIGSSRSTDRYSFVLLMASIIFLPTSLRAQEAPKAAIANVAPAKPAAEKQPDTYTTRLFLTSADGSDPKQLTVFPEYTSQGSPEWSRDGKLICFDGWKMGGSTATGQIIVVNADGTNPRAISDGLMPSFSPGGKRIAFTRSGKERGVWIMSTQGPETELVQIDQNGWGTSWAPDGRVAYTTSTTGGANLMLLNIVDGTRELVFNEEKSPYQTIYWNFAFSPDSKRIVFKGITPEGKREVGIVDSRGEKFGFTRRPLLTDVHESFCWTADGSRILVTKPCPERENLTQVYSLNPDQDEPLQLLSKQDSERPAVTAACSPDGKRLAITCLTPTSAKIRASKAEIPAEKLKAKFVADFRGKQPDPKVIKSIGEPSDQFHLPGKTGLKINLPANKDKPNSAGIAANLRLHGDFEVIVEYHDLKLTAPATDAGPKIELHLALDSLTYDHIRIERKVLPNGEHRVETRLGLGPILEGTQTQGRMNGHPTKALSARFKIVRKEATLYYLAADYGSNEYRLLDECPVATDDAKLLEFTARAVEQASGSEVILDQLSIRAEAFAEKPK